MPTSDIKQIKQEKRDYTNKVKRFKTQLNKLQTKPHLTTQKKEVDAKVNAIDYYNSLSEGEKLAFQEELKKKEIRNDYCKYLKYVYGDTYTLTKFHIFLAKLGESIVKRIEKGNNVYVCISVPPQVGKGYPVEFPILTTKGWKQHGNLKVGDFVYNDKGKQVMVLGNQKPYMHKCLKVTFANGESHIVTREHLWKVYLEKEIRDKDKKHHNIREEHIIETQELMNILPKCRRSPYILINKPLKNEEKDLLINPYILGLWLGDGCSANNEVVCSDKDLKETLYSIGDKEVYSLIKRKDNKNVTYIRLGNLQSQKPKEKGGKLGYKREFVERLHKLNVLNNKHIPTEYLLASEEQRWELLRGLMDTDGCADIRGTCEFCNTNKELAYNVYTLLHSLGIKATIGEYDAKLYGRFISKKYRIYFSHNKTDHIFNMGRKQRIVESKNRGDREDKYKYFIKSIEEVEDRLVSCISVEGGMYLAGKELIPTHNSMTITETLPSWFLGRNPDLRCITTAYNADIAEKFGDKPRQQIKKFGKDLFGIEISDSQDNKTIWDIKDHLGGMYSTGINGSLTSNAGALIIVDDPIKNEVEANNPSIREQIWANFSTSLWTRQRAGGCAIIVIQTRWHEDDLIGRILENDIDNKWVYVNIPCIWESGVDKILHRRVGETICPERGFTAEWVETTRKLLGERRFNALYQGKPFVDGGDILKRDMLRFYDKSSLPSVFEELTMSCDLSFGGKKNDNDPCGIAIWGRTGGNHYLLDYIIKKLSFTETLDRIRYLCGKYPQIKGKIIEKKANGDATIEVLNREIGGFIAYDPKGNSKEDRLQLCLPYFESGNVYFPSEKVDKDFEKYTQILLKFPKVAHDEIVDITTQYLLNYQYKYSGRVNTDSHYAELAKAIRGFKV